VVDKNLRLQGPLRTRKCTDLLFTLIFLGFMGVMGWVFSYGLENGKPEVLLSPVDQDRKLCGVDYVNHPYLLYIVQLKLTQEPAVQSSRQLDDDMPLMFGLGQAFPELGTFGVDFEYTTNAVCVDHCPKEQDSTFTCMGTTGVSTNTCQTPISNTTGIGYIPYGSDTLFGKFCFPNINKFPEELNVTDEFSNIIGEFGLDDVQQYYEDIMDAKMAYLYCVGTCLVVAVVYNILLRFFAKILIWVSILGTGCGLLALSLFLRSYHEKYYYEGSGYSDNMGNIIQLSTYFLYGATGLFFCCVLCMFRNIQISVAVLKTAAVIIIRNIRVLIVPFVSFVFIIGYIGGWIYGFGYLISCANINLPVTENSQLKTINLNGKDELKWQIAVWVFGLFWVVELLSAIFKYWIIVGVCTWYFTSSHDTRGNFTLMKGFWWSLRYNFGSLALGSFVLAIIWSLRVIFEYLDKKLKNAMGNNAAAACVSNMIRCCLDCCHRFIKFLNDNAYIQVALTGCNFCSSAMQAFALALKHSGSFMVTNGIGALIGFLGKMTISIANVFLGYVMITNISEISDSLDSPIGPLVIIFVISYLMASIFMSVYATTSLTILQCLYADVDICSQNGDDKYNSKFRPAEMEDIVRTLAK
jgi:choline transporter-like protein 2/4/5